MASATDLPLDYRPYRTINLCGNKLVGVGAILRIGDVQPLLVGRGADSHPQVWLYARRSPTESWIPVVSSNMPAPYYTLEKHPLTVVKDAARPRTVVIAGSVIIVNAQYNQEEDGVDISAIDLRPLGLNIYGDDHIGLLFAGNLFVGNTMNSVGTAFAASA